MQLPEISLPTIPLPFDIQLLLHPAVDHFVIAIPVVVLLLELYNLVVKRSSISVFSLLLLLLAVGFTFGAYITGVTDGKEAYDMLSPEGQEELKAHKLLGTYILFMSAFVVIVKLLAMALRSALFRALFIVILLGYIAVLFFQGKEGGELVYEYGANVSKVKALDDELFDCKDELSDAQEEAKEAADSQNTPAAVSKEAPAAAAPSVPTETQDNQQSSTSTSAQTTKHVDALIESAKQKVEAASKEVLSKVKEKAGSMEMPATPAAPEAVKIETH